MEINVFHGKYGRILMISVKVYLHGNDMLIGACDENLLGKKFVEGKLQLDVKRSFYDGHRITADTLRDYLENATIANLVGKETVECGIKMGLIDPDCVITIQGIPHAQMVKMLR